uniref:Mitochondrial carrier domain-containing protein n=1 Tax=Rhabditophanes sp. KR3021 TaxID=114890 RepID=A0AC35TNL5_9BILA
MALTDNHIPSYKLLLSSGVGGISAIAIGLPFDTIKVRPQASDPNTYRSTLHCFTNLIKTQGPTALFKGIVPITSVAGPCFAFYMFANKRSLEFVNSFSNSREKTLSQQCIAGGMAGL